MKVYKITDKSGEWYDVDYKFFDPEIPYTLDSDNNEDSTTNRICVSNSIVGALYSIQHNLNIGEYYVWYADISPDKLYQPTDEQVSDVDLTGELWVTQTTKFYKHKRLEIINPSTLEFNIITI